MCAAAEASVCATAEASVWAEIAQGLLAPYPKHSLKFGHMLDWGHLLHHLIGVAKMQWGLLWPTHLVISDSTSAQGILKQQQGAKIICTVIFTDSHWALLVYRVASRFAVLVDGKTDQAILQKSQAFFFEFLKKEFPLADGLVSSSVSRPGLEGHLLAHVCQVHEHSRNNKKYLNTSRHYKTCLRIISHFSTFTPLSLAVGAIRCFQSNVLEMLLLRGCKHVQTHSRRPVYVFKFVWDRQEDNWSCGHRCILALKHILCTDSWPPAFPVDAFSEEALKEDHRHCKVLKFWRRQQKAEQIPALILR